MSSRDPHDDEALYPSDYSRGVVSGEAVPPDEHTRRVQALRQQKSAREATVLEVHDDTRTHVAASDPSEPRGRTSRGSVTADSPTMASVPTAKGQGASIARPEIAVPAHGSRHAAAQAAAESAARAAADAATRAAAEARAAAARAAEAAAAHAAAQAREAEARAAEARAAEARAAEELAAASGTRSRQAALSASTDDPSLAPTTPPKTTSELAERSKKERRRERDRRAEKTALRAVIFTFVLLGVGLYALLNSDLVDTPVPESDATPATKAPPRPRPVTTAEIDETPDLPALRQLATEGLTIAAEGLPEVLASDGSSEASLAAAIETCRFAYGIWEFSPNKRFRFITTCPGLEGQILVGAYEARGSQLLLSPLVDGVSTMVSLFEVEKPSKMTTEIAVGAGARRITLGVNQRVTAMRGGLQGEAFRDTYAPRNTLSVPGGRARPAPSEGATKGTKRDPLYELLKAQKAGGEAPPQPQPEE